MKKSIFGSGGHAREVLTFLGEDTSIFVDDEYCKDGELPVSCFDPTLYELLICVGDPIHRKKIVEKLPASTKYFSYIHPTSIVPADLALGEGSFIGPYSIITTNVRIGRHAILNRMVQIGHDSEIGDFFSAMPGSVISGNCQIGDAVYLGTNSSIRERLRVVDNVTIGLNSGVVKGIDSPGIYAGSPAKKISL